LNEQHLEPLEKKQKTLPPPISPNDDIIYQIKKNIIENLQKNNQIISYNPTIFKIL
jgi:regulatory protein YycI of two-component signal transduction system YycFG